MTKVTGLQERFQGLMPMDLGTRDQGFGTGAADPTGPLTAVQGPVCTSDYWPLSWLASLPVRSTGSHVFSEEPN
ncbi:uncharacterized protein BDCG_17031 [Blastomyces dermatitidis ER-3]|uniref:Uncharacterized protein n=3 Tax=Blastomyces TaxID=229219 RepID=A0A179UY71_BLAGS|nr:uncharacterized protein BDBG_17613 [Blastomyces gilchristii SLH14081]XP_045281041.1 uncharacterized protein BDCG_17031 [Blastomyces dermatitidis ER-3]KMW67379.1 hypothetical protein BDDG_12088 [Blastomyces dermatitidis ATCC 18188]OAT01314.1 hypothetical protein BDCG_17031 [Blastomyces dermatitidis ER-3]OAT12057.1 hypothetical protein BDBG_17613 [Blastomyces gilchristii SLH14081]